MVAILPLAINIKGISALCRRISTLLAASHQSTDDVLDDVIDELDTITDKLAKTNANSMIEVLLKIDTFLSMLDDDCDGSCVASRCLLSVRKDVSRLAAGNPTH